MPPVEIDINVKGNAHAKLSELSDVARRGNAIHNVTNLMLQEQIRLLEAIGQKKQALGTPGASSPLNVGSAVTTVTAAVTATLQRLTPVVGKFNDSLATTEQKMRTAIEAVPVFGGLFKSIIDFAHEASGAADRMRMANLGLQQWQASQAVLAQGRAETMSLSAASHLAGARGAAFGDVQLTPALTARTTLGQQTAYREQQRLLPLLDAASLAGAERQAAGQQLELLRSRRRQQQSDTSGREAAVGRLLDARLNRARAAYSGDREGNLTANIAVQRESALLAEREAQIRATIAGTRQAEVSLAEATRREAQANLAIDRERLDTLRQREQVARSQAQSIGAMDPLDRQMALQASQRVRAYGWEGVSMTDRSAFRSMFPQEAAVRAQQSGEQFIRQNRLRETHGDEIRDIASEIQPQVDAMEGQVRRRPAEIGQDFENSIQQGFDRLISAMQVAWQHQAELAAQQIRDFAAYRNAQQ